MQIEKPSQAGSQTKEGEPHCSSLHICFGGISEVFCCDAQWAQMNTESESCVWEWVSVECLFFLFSSGNGNNLTLFLGGWGCCFFFWIRCVGTVAVGEGGSSSSSSSFPPSFLSLVFFSLARSLSFSSRRANLQAFCGSAGFNGIPVAKRASKCSIRGWQRGRCI